MRSTETERLAPGGKADAIAVRSTPTSDLGAGDCARADLLLRLATGLFLNGQDTSRTLREVARMAGRWHLDWSLSAAWGHVTLLMREEGRPTTLAVREAAPIATNMRRVMALMVQVERLAAGAPADAVRAAVEAAGVLPPLATPVFALAAGLGACALAVIFGETQEAALLVIAMAAVTGGLARRALDHLGRGLLAQDFGAALIAGLAAAVVAQVGIVGDVRLVALCPCMILIPGPHLLNGAIDLLAHRIPLGVARLVFAVLGLMAISTGLVLGLAASGHGLPAGGPPATVPLWKDAIAGGVAAACYAVFYALPLPMLIWPAMAGLLAHAVHWGAQAAGLGAAPATAVASLVASFVVLPITHRFHLPFAGVGFAATVSMLPGIFIFPMSSALVVIAERGAQADPALVTGALGDGITALQVVLGMTLGLVAPKRIHDVWRRGSARPDASLTVAGVLDA